MSSDAAAWVQAVGSVLAVVVAIIVSVIQTRASRKMLRDEWEHQASETRRIRMMRLRSIANVLEKCAGAAKASCGAITGSSRDPQSMLRQEMTRLDSILGWLDQMPVSSEPGIMISGDLANLRLSVVQIREIVHRTIENERVALRAEDWARLSSAVDRINAISRKVSEYADGYKGEYVEIRAPDLE